MTKDQEKYLTVFDETRKLYPNTKRGNQTEFDNFKRHKDWKKALPLLLPAVKKQIRWRETAKGKFRPEWKNFRTWINQRCWEEEIVDDLELCVICRKNGHRKDGNLWLCEDCEKYAPTYWGHIPVVVLTVTIEVNKAKAARRDSNREWEEKEEAAKAWEVKKKFYTEFGKSK